MHFSRSANDPTSPKASTLVPLAANIAATISTLLFSVAITSKVFFFMKINGRHFHCGEGKKDTFSTIIPLISNELLRRSSKQDLNSFTLPNSIALIAEPMTDDYMEKINSQLISTFKRIPLVDKGQQID